MIRGLVFEGRPYVRVSVVAPRLRAGGEILCLVDTGADDSLIHPRDFEKLGVSRETFGDLMASPSRGIGGTAAEYMEPAFVLIQHQDGYRDRMLLPLHFAVPTDANTLIPSLLGRDVLSYYRLVFDQRAGLVTLENSGS